MKKIMNPEVELINLEANDILCSSPNFNGEGVDAGGSGISARGYFDEDEEWY